MTRKRYTITTLDKMTGERRKQTVMLTDSQVREYIAAGAKPTPAVAAAFALRSN